MQHHEHYSAAGMCSAAGTQLPPREPEQDLDEPDLSQLDQAVEKGHLDVKVRPVSLARSNSAIKAGMLCYKMSANPRGLALIIEIERYVNDIKGRRIGSQFDVDNLTRLLQGLGFKVQVLHNLKKADFLAELGSFAANPQHGPADMMIMAVLSHGRNGHIYAADGSVIATETIYQHFNNTQCPLLKGKPKFFIIQACRGEEIDKADHGDDVPLMRMFHRKRARMRGTDMDSKPWKRRYSDIDRARPTWEDMIIAYSTIPGFASIREHDRGTWFIQSLVEVFCNHAHDKELIDLLRMTSQRLSHFTNSKREKQTCNVEMRHLYKRIYFMPGFFEQDIHQHMSSIRLNKSHSPKLRRSKSTPPASPKRALDHQNPFDGQLMDHDNAA